MKISIALKDAKFEFDGPNEGAADARHLADRFYDCVHAEPGSADRKLDQIQTQLAALSAQGDRMEQTAAQMKQALIDVNTATDEIASDIAELKSKLEGGLTASEAADVQQQLDALVARSKAVAAEYTADAPNA